ncbi:hypothetical protein [Pelosinus sp. IPA-1]|uniref:hypothetical protein n=1 Tax=Pelosinus sp. IPA-1 TaxID=3029569 RepID=UPI0024362A39|nr:hypothetical protein [Pelosinus sp. IPA-1]GMA98172.1 hypothetical protein PIPA1_09720 [Pelosinus sp. IPA-1]
MTDSTLIGFWVSTILTCLVGVVLLIGKHVQAGSSFIFLGFAVGSFSSLVLWKVKGIDIVSPVTSIIALLSSMLLLAYFIMNPLN